MDYESKIATTTAELSALKILLNSNGMSNSSFSALVCNEMMRLRRKLAVLKHCAIIQEYIDPEAVGIYGIEEQIPVDLCIEVLRTNLDSEFSRTYNYTKSDVDALEKALKSKGILFINNYAY